ncbi:MSHA biogenesis protein MshN [Vibrio ponticus]|nr:MSHA biogenesis protein MshN [Vibrio ponticus]
MSAINNALSELSKSQTVAKAGIEKAQVQIVKRARVLPWVIGGFSLSLAVGGWALSQQSLPKTMITSEVIPSEPIPAESISQPKRNAVSVPSPTVKLAQTSETIYDAPVTTTPETASIAPAVKANDKAAVQKHVVEKPIDVSSETDVVVDEKPVVLASVAKQAEGQAVEVEPQLVKSWLNRCS